jgi:hypothetical protein
MTAPALRWWRVTLAGLIAIPLLLLIRAWLSPRPGPRFGDVGELKAWAQSRGWYCQSDSKDSKVLAGLALSTHPLTWEQVASFCRASFKEGPEWEGMIWAINRPAALDAMPGPPWKGECRLWGNILVTGDRCLLDRIEEEAS